jgi:hypothetical protein
MSLEGHLAAAAEPYRQMFELDPGNLMGRLFYVWVLAVNARLPGVERSWPGSRRDARQRARAPRPVPGARAGGEAARGLRGPRNDSGAWTPATDVFARFLAQGYALAGMTEPALHWLAIAVDRGFINHPFLARHDPLLASLRGDVRFKELMTTVRGRWRRFEA